MFYVSCAGVEWRPCKASIEYNLPTHANQSSARIAGIEPAVGENRDSPAFTLEDFPGGSRLKTPG